MGEQEKTESQMSKRSKRIIQADDVFKDDMDDQELARGMSSKESVTRSNAQKSDSKSGSKSKPLSASQRSPGRDGKHSDSPERQVPKSKSTPKNLADG